MALIKHKKEEALNQIKAMVSMGYRKMNTLKEIWGKPVGNVLFTIEIYKNPVLWTNWFVDAENKNSIWDSYEYGAHKSGQFNFKGAFLEWIKYCETWSRIDAGAHADGKMPQFEFLSLAESIELEL